MERTLVSKLTDLWLNFFQTKIGVPGLILEPRPPLKINITFEDVQIMFK